MVGASIPQTFHRIWLGDNPMPRTFERYGHTWLEHHPGWEMLTWTEPELSELRNDAAFTSARSMAQKADIARYEILWRCGGVYVDTDFLCLRNLGPLLAGADLIAGWQDSNSVNVGLIGAVPGHRVLDEVIRAIPKRLAARPNDPISVQTGPGLFTEVVTSHVGADPAIVLYEPALLYPYHWTEAERSEEEFPDAYAVHHWAKGWE